MVFEGINGHHVADGAYHKCLEVSWSWWKHGSDGDIPKEQLIMKIL
jgi:hypothetical protein